MILPEVRNIPSEEESSCFKTSSSLPDITTENDSKIERKEGRKKSYSDFAPKKRFQVKQYLEATKPVEESILLYLLEQKANVNAKDFYGSTSLHFAAMRGNVMAVKQLLSQKGINIEVGGTNLILLLPTEYI